MWSYVVLLLHRCSSPEPDGAVSCAKTGVHYTGLLRRAGRRPGQGRCLPVTVVWFEVRVVYCIVVLVVLVLVALCQCKCRWWLLPLLARAAVTTSIRATLLRSVTVLLRIPSPCMAGVHPHGAGFHRHVWVTVLAIVQV
jgi:hypothetical protein